MLFFYSLLLTFAMLLMSPLFFLRRQKYASGFSERLGTYPEFIQDDRAVIWLHCVSVGETNAARPLVDELIKKFPSHRLVVSTTTRTGQELADKIFGEKADAVFYFPFDWKFSVRRALKTFRPSFVLLMETEIWPRFISEAKRAGAKVAIVNGRLSERSFQRYSKVGRFVRRVLRQIDLASMQSDRDVERIKRLGMTADKVHVAGNLKFDHPIDYAATTLTEEFRRRFAIGEKRPLVVAASTHDPEESLILDALEGEIGNTCRLVLVPRHPERFEVVADLVKKRTDCRFVRRSTPLSEDDKRAEIILLDSIGELRALYPLADIVFVGGSLISRGGQSILEPAAFGKAIVTGHFTHNFSDAVETFLKNDALVQLADLPVNEIKDALFAALFGLLTDPVRRDELGHNAAAVMAANRGATGRTIQFLTERTGDW